MKRAHSCSDIEQTHSHPAAPKRRQLSPLNSSRYGLRSSTSRSSQRLHLTPETLDTPPVPSSAAHNLTESIELWARDCDRCCEADMAPPQTPSVASNDSDQRRTSKLNYRRHRSQSPSKKSSPQYRLRNMADANIFVDHFPDPPSDVEEQLKHIFGIAMLEDIGKDSVSENLFSRSADQNWTGELAEKYCHKSRQMAKDCAGAGQWKSWLLTGLVEPMQELWSDIIKLSASEKPWMAELRPTPPSFEDILGSIPPPPIFLESRIPTAELPLSPRDPVLPQTPILSPPSAAPSDLTTDDPNRVSIPKPDIAVGLSHTSFSKLHGRMLWDLQDRDGVLSEPHQAAIGLHFPFLIIEAKGFAIGSNLIGAQNQAAVDGACALNILRDLKLTEIAHRPRGPVDQPQARQILFSIVTEGPVHELWVHYQIAETYHMTLLRIWRTTFTKETREFVQALGKILEWGSSSFRAAILHELTAIETVLRERRME